MVNYISGLVFFLLLLLGGAVVFPLPELPEKR